MNTKQNKKTKLVPNKPVKRTALEKLQKRLMDRQIGVSSSVTKFAKGHPTDLIEFIQGNRRMRTPHAAEAQAWCELAKFVKMELRYEVNRWDQDQQYFLQFKVRTVADGNDFVGHIKKAHSRMRSVLSDHAGGYVVMSQPAVLSPALTSQAITCVEHIISCAQDTQLNRDIEKKLNKRLSKKFETWCDVRVQFSGQGNHKKLATLLFANCGKSVVENFLIKPDVVNLSHISNDEHLLSMVGSLIVQSTFNQRQLTLSGGYLKYVFNRAFDQLKIWSESKGYETNLNSKNIMDEWSDILGPHAVSYPFSE